MQICGIDEAGRGAIAGDMTIAACLLFKQINGLNDSKKLSPKKRDELFEEIIKNSKYLIIYFNCKQIDKNGLSNCLRSGLETFKSYFKADDCTLLYDGNCNYGTKIKTMIKADLYEQSVSAASILAKVSRDRVMELKDEIYPNFGFKIHKGYGTKEHIEKIEKFGLSQIHRKTFKIKKLEKTLF